MTAWPSECLGAVRRVPNRKVARWFEGPAYGGHTGGGFQSDGAAGLGPEVLSLGEGRVRRARAKKNVTAAAPMRTKRSGFTWSPSPGTVPAGRTVIGSVRRVSDVRISAG